MIGRRKLERMCLSGSASEADRPRGGKTAYKNIGARRKD